MIIYDSFSVYYYMIRQNVTSTAFYVHYLSCYRIILLILLTIQEKVFQISV